MGNISWSTSRWQNVWYCIFISKMFDIISSTTNVRKSSRTWKPRASLEEHRRGPAFFVQVLPIVSKRFAVENCVSEACSMGASSRWKSFRSSKRLSAEHSLYLTLTYMTRVIAYSLVELQSMVRPCPYADTAVITVRSCSIVIHLLIRRWAKVRNQTKKHHTKLSTIPTQHSGSFEQNCAIRDRLT